MFTATRCLSRSISSSDNVVPPALMSSRMKYSRLMWLRACAIARKKAGNAWAPSFSNLCALPHMVHNELIADVVAVIGSIDIVLGDVDR